MWNALRSDLQDFVSGVADETKEVTDRLDINVGQALSPSSSAVDTSQESGAAVDDSGDDDVAATENSMALDEVDRRMNEEETYTLELDESDQFVQSFLKDFDLESKTDEITQLLQDHPDTLHRYFEQLVPTQVSYKEFWTRYFYRCDAIRIEDEWERQQEQARQAAAKAIEGGLKTVSNLFGGALQSVSQTLKAADQTAAERRPPFVLNTAVDEDDDEEEEEELGWGDDDSFDDMDNDDNKNDSTAQTNETQEGEEAIIFTDTQMETLQQQLAQALEERDQLQKTVEMQTKEIKNMQTGQAVPKEIEHLKMKLFEKDSELAALKASREDDDGGAGSGEPSKSVEKTQQLEEALAKLARAEQVAKEKDELLASQAAASASQGDALVKQLQAEKAELVEDQKAHDEKRQTEIAALKKELADCKATASSKANELSSKLKTATERTRTLESQLEKAKTALSQAAAEFSKEMEQEIAKLKQAHAAELAKKEQDAEAKFKGEAESTGSSRKTTDTGVLIGNTSPSAAPPAAADDDDWGDDW